MVQEKLKHGLCNILGLQTKSIMVCYGIFWIGQSSIEYTEHVAMILLTDHQKNSFPERNS